MLIFMSCQTPGQTYGFTPYEAPQATLDQLEQFQSEKLRARNSSRPPGVPLKGAGPDAFCKNGHQPLDYDDFRAHCIGVVDWPGYGEYSLPGEPQWMHQGHCQNCKSTISYPPPAGLQHPDDYVYPIRQDIEAELIANDRAITEDDLDAMGPISGQELDSQAFEDAAWLRIPEPLRVALVRYIRRRISPGGFLRAFLEGDIETARNYATPTSILAVPDLTHWVFNYAPRESFGDFDLVAAWLGGGQ